MSGPVRFEKNHVLVDAWEWDETMSTLSSMEQAGIKWTNRTSHALRPDECRQLSIRTLDGTARVLRGDYVVKSEEGIRIYTAEEFNSIFHPVKSCHLTAPLRATREGTRLTLFCYVPECGRVVAVLELAQ